MSAMSECAATRLRYRLGFSAGYGETSPGSGCRGRRVTGVMSGKMQFRGGICVGTSM